MTESNQDGKLILTWPWSTSWLGRLFTGYVGLICLGQPVLALDKLFSDPMLGLQMLGALPIGGSFFVLLYAMTFNKTELTVEEGALTVRHFPVWWGQPRRFEGVWALRVERYRHRRVYYRIYARVSGGREVVLVSGLEEHQALQLSERLRPACRAL